MEKEWWRNGGEEGGGGDGRDEGKGKGREDGYTRTLLEYMITAQHSSLPPGARKCLVVYPLTFVEIIQIQCKN